EAVWASAASVGSQVPDPVATRQLRMSACASIATQLPHGISPPLPARTGLLHCSANQQIIDNSVAGGPKKSPESGSIRHDRAADHQWGMVSSCCHYQPGLQIFNPQTNCKVQYGGTRL